MKLKSFVMTILGLGLGLSVMTSCSNVDMKQGNRKIASVNHPQYVLLAFDGSKSIPMWKETVKFADDMRKNGKDVNFTYFVSSVYYLKQAKAASVYTGPHHGAGKSDIGFSENDSTVLSNRIQATNNAKSEGHEIASHACGHFDGNTWTKDDWRKENAFFNKIMFDSSVINGVSTKPIFTKEDIKGMRAPLLAQKTAELYPALKEDGFTYDTSNITTPTSYPRKQYGIWNFALGSLRIPTSEQNLNTLSTAGKKTLSMDYNFFVAHTAGVDLTMDNVKKSLMNNGLSAEDAAAKAPEAYRKKIKQFEDETYWTYMTYFNVNYNGKRAPIHIGHHFSKWNDGAYWNAMKRFAAEVCGKDEVKCVTYSELVSILEKNPELSNMMEKEIEMQEKELPAILPTPKIYFSIEKNSKIVANLINTGIDSELFSNSVIEWQIAELDQNESREQKANKSILKIKSIMPSDNDDVEQNINNQFISKLKIKNVFKKFKTKELAIRATVVIRDTESDETRDILVATRKVTLEKNGKITIGTKDLEDEVTQRVISDMHDQE